MIRVFPRKTKWTPTDELSFIGDPPMIRPDPQPVHVSCTFTWDIPKALRLQQAWGQYYDDVQIGGPAFQSPNNDFIPGRYMKEGVTITSRGCIRKCPWCFVPQWEGVIRELPITDGWIIQDNNLLACSREHIEAVFEMLKRQPEPIEFKGGLDGRLLEEWHIDLFNQIRIGELWFACDTPAEIKTLERVADLTADYSPNKKRCFVMIGFNGESMKQALKRLFLVYHMGFDPFCQLYQSDKPTAYSHKWRNLARYWQRPAIYHRVKRKTAQTG